MIKKILTVLLVVCLALSATGCAKEDPAAEARKVVEGYLTAMLSGNVEELSKYFELSDVYLTDMNEQMYKLVFNDCSYEFGETTVYSNKQTVDMKVKFTNIDAAECISAAMRDYVIWAIGAAFSDKEYTDEELDAQLLEILQEKYLIHKDSKVENNVTITVTKETTGWTISSVGVEEDFINAVTGGVIAGIEAMESAFSDMFE